MVFDRGSIFAHGRCSSVRSSAGRRYRSSAGWRYRAGSSAGWRRAPVVSLAGGDFVRIPYMFIISFLFEFLIPFPLYFRLGCNPIPPCAGLLPFWCLTGWGRTSTSGAVLFSENFGGPALRPRARQPGACLRGIAPGVPPYSIVGRGRLHAYSLLVYPFFSV